MNSAPTTRQRSMKRGGNRQGGFPRGPPPPPPLPAFPIPDITQRNFTEGVDTGPESSFRNSRPTGGFVSHSNSSNEHSNNRTSNWRGNSKQHSCGDGRNNYHEGQPHQDHGNHDWSSSPNPHGRGAHEHPHRLRGRGFMGPSIQGAPPFVPPPPIRSYGNTLVYPGELCFLFHSKCLFLVYEYYVYLLICPAIVISKIPL